MSRSEDATGASATIVRPVVIAVVIQLVLTALTTLAKLHSGRDDTDIYFRYAMLVFDGQVPYRDFRVEYPPLALPLFLAAALVSHGVTGFKVVFAIEMLVFNAATVWLVAAWVEQSLGRAAVRMRLAWYTVPYMLLSRLVVSRYDAAAMCVGFAASIWWFSGRSVRGGAAAAVGTLMKVYPGIVAIVAAPRDLLASRDRRGTGTLAYVATLLLGSLGWFVIGGAHGVAESLGYQLDRGFEFGSIYSGLQMLAATVARAEIAVVRDHAAWSSVTPWSASLLPVVFPIQTATVLIVGGTFVRRGMTEGVRYTGAAILAFILMGKVFSPQYLIWMLPFITVLEGPIARRGFWLFTAGCAVTLVAPALTGSFSRTSLVVILTYNVRNALLLCLLVLLSFGPGSGGSHSRTTT